MNMDNPKYLIIIALIDGQNFAVPDGAPDKVEATVFAEARFGNESILRSDPIKLTNSNPEFVTELAWQLDKRSLHQLRIERKAIKLQVFMQTRERKKSTSRMSDANGQPMSNGQFNQDTGSNGETHKVELIGYTVLDLRSAQPKEHTKFQWYPLLNPKFRKSSYNRPEIQLAVTMSRSEEEDNDHRDSSMNQFSSISTLPDGDVSSDYMVHTSQDNGKKSLEIPSNNFRHETGSSTQSSSENTKLYTTCLDTTANSNLENQQQAIQSDEIIDNDIMICSKDGLVHIYDAKHPHKFTIDDCDERYTLTVTIPFTTNLDLLVTDYDGNYYFTVSLFGTTLRTTQFRELTNVNPKEMSFVIQTTHAGVLATYFELKSNLDIKFYRSLSSNKNECIGLATIQLNQLCSLDTTCRSIEGIFALQSFNNETELEYSSSDENPTIGVSVVLERYDPNHARQDTNKAVNNDSTVTMRQDIDCDGLYDYIPSGHDTHQLTIEDSFKSDRSLPNTSDNNLVNLKTGGSDNILVEDRDTQGPSQDDHHYCFTIDLKEFSYTLSQRLIPTLRELVIRYSYPFFGYKDTITTDASIPINSTNSIIVSGFCEFNFATTSRPLLTALNELPLNLEVLAVNDSRLRNLDGDRNPERLVATCSINLAKLLDLNQANISQLAFQPVSRTSLVPIFALNGDEIGQLQLSLCLKDLGSPAKKIEASIENFTASDSLQNPPINLLDDEDLTKSNELKKVDQFILQASRNFESWKEESLNKLSEEQLRRDNDRFKRLYQRVEAKEVRRDQEFKKKMDDLGCLEKKFKNSLICIESLEKMLVDSLEHLKTKSTLLDNRLDMIELKISESKMCNGATATEWTSDVEQVSAQRASLSQATAKLDKLSMQPQRSFDDNLLKSKCVRQPPAKTTTSQSSLIANGTRNCLDRAPRRSSLRTATLTGASSPGSPRAQIPVATRSTSLVRKPSETAATVTRIVKRNSYANTAIVFNEINSRVRSNPTKFNLSRENQEKLANLRKEKAELLKRGCKPTDELIREINLRIEKLCC